MQNNLYKKILVCGIILMFIAGAIIPIITAGRPSEKPSKEDPNNPNTENMIETIVELWKPDGVEYYTVWLTEDRTMELDSLINEFKIGLQTAETFEKTIGIYCDMLICLCELGLFNNETIVNQAQQLTTSIIETERMRPKTKTYSSFEERVDSAITDEEKQNILIEGIEFLDQLNILPIGMSADDTQQILSTKVTTTNDEGISMPGDTSLGMDENFLCLTAGVPQATRFYSTAELFFDFLYQFYLKLIEWAEENNFFDNLPFNGDDLEKIPDDIAYILDLFSIHVHLPLGHLIGFGNDEKSPASGWVHTVGLNGIKKWDGFFYGQITALENLDPEIKNIGTVGFTGIRITPNNLYLGAALWVKMGFNPPENPDFQIEQPVSEEDNLDQPINEQDNLEQPVDEEEVVSPDNQGMAK